MMCDNLCGWPRISILIRRWWRRQWPSEGRRTKKEAVTEALREYIARRRQAQVTRIFGTVEYDPKYDYKKQRRRR